MKVVVAAFLTLGLSLPRLVGSAEDPFELAQSAYSGLDYEKVMPLAKRALDETKDPGREAQIYALMAHVHVIYGRSVLAQQAFREVLRRNNEYRVGAEASPKVIAAFEAARAAVDAEIAGAAERIAQRPPPSLVPPSDTDAPHRRHAAFYETWWVWAAATGVLVATAGGYWAWSAVHPPEPAHDAGPVKLK